LRFADRPRCLDFEILRGHRPALQKKASIVASAKGKIINDSMDNSFDSPAEILFEEAPEQKFPWLNVALFALTCLSTLIMGTALMAMYTNSLEDLGPFLGQIARSPSILINGLPFSFAIMIILLGHEMGHYLTCRYYGIDATLPYFIPAPTPVGTMGAFIRIKSPIQHRAALLEVGIAGPIVGFVLAIPILAVALAKSGYVAPGPPGSTIGLGEPLIFKVIEVIMGKIPPPGMEINLHPIGIAAWFGLYATALNLIPVGQLDGGHVLYALFRQNHKHISQAFLFALIPLGLFYWHGWLLWTTVLLIIGFRHPVTLNDSVPLSKRHLWLGWIGLAMFVLCFTPMPFYFN
jgi:membrane-associated protease RseP (regulator of RpoE activity)